MRTYKTYSAEFKLKVVNDYLSGGITIKELSKKYQIGLSTVFTWIDKCRGKINSSLVDVTTSVKDEIIDVSSRHDSLQKQAAINQRRLISLNINGVDITVSPENLRLGFEALRQ